MSLEADYNTVKTQLAELREALTLGEASDGHHTHNELYTARLMLTAHAMLGWQAAGYQVCRSRLHHDGEVPFGGGWFIVHAELRAGPITFHYQDEHWQLFTGIPEVTRAPLWDGHTSEVAMLRLAESLPDASALLRVAAKDAKSFRLFDSVESIDTVRACTGCAGCEGCQR